MTTEPQARLLPDFLYHDILQDIKIQTDTEGRTGNLTGQTGSTPQTEPDRL